MWVLLVTFLTITVSQSNTLYTKLEKEKLTQEYVRGFNSDYIWSRRINATMSLIENSPCLMFQEEPNCTLQLNISRSNMTLYTAERKVDGEKLHTILPDKSLGRERAHDAVIVIDPFPQANFGHNVFLFFIYYDKETFCLKRGGVFTYFGECIIPAHKKHCQNMIHRRRKRRCNVDFLPLVHVEGDESKQQRLECQSYFAGFGQCPDFNQKIVREPLKCENAPRGCSSRPKEPVKQYCLWKSCDYAVLLAGTWNKLTGRRRAEKNIKMMWNHFIANGYKKENIEIFYGNDGAIEVDGDPETKDALPASREFGVRKHIHDLCLSWNCVDTLTIYLNNPTRNNGAMLLWDNNGDGLVEDSEMYSVREIFYDLVGCGAKRVFIIADQSFSEYLVDKLRQLIKNGDSDGDWYKKISIFASSSFSEPSWRTDFTESWVKTSQRTKCMRNIFQETRKEMTRIGNTSYPNMAEGNPFLGQLTLFGGPCSDSSSKGMGCKSLPPGSWRLPPRQGEDGSPKKRQWPEEEDE